jgi:tryptophan-rich sensory protein
MKSEKVIKYVLPVASVLLVALLGWVFVDIGMDWFNGLKKPSEWIPNALIPIVWTFIYSVFILYIIH